MHITIEHHQGQYPSFNVNLHSAKDSEAFLSVKGCRIVNGQNGAFVSWPSRKNEQTGKYWNHCWGSEAFNAAVLQKAQASQPAAAPPPPRQAAPVASGFSDMEDDIPF